MTRLKASRSPLCPQPQTDRTPTHPPPGGGGTIQAGKSRRADGRGSGDAIGKNRKERKTAIIGHRKQLLPSFLIISSEHPARDNTKQTALAAHPLPYLTASPIYPLSFVPPSSPPPLSKSGARRHGKQATPTPDNTHPPPSALSHQTAHRTATGMGTGNRTATGTGTGCRTSTPSPPPSKQDGTPDIPISPLPVANKR